MPVVTIRFAKPRATKGGSAFDEAAMQRDLQAQLELLLQQRLGDDLELRLELAESSEIRLEGRFPLKPLEVKGVVSEALGEIMEGFDPSGYAL